MLLDNPIFLVVAVTAIVCGALLFGTGAFQLWLTSVFAKAPVSLVAIIGMKMRMVKAGDVVTAYIVCRKAEAPVTIEELEALYLSSPQQFIPEVQKMVGGHMKEKKQ